jgi:hypothetical protein
VAPAAVARVTRSVRASDWAFALGLLIGVAVNVAVGAAARHDAVIGYADFSYIWAGPRTILDGADPYDPAQWAASVARLGTEPYDDPAVYSYPPYVALLLLPLGALPLAIADGIWKWGGLAAAVAAVLLLMRTYAIAAPAIAFVAALTLTVSHASAFAFYGGQWSFVLIAALAVLAIAAQRARAVPALAGAIVLLAKPQLALVALGGLALRSWLRHDRAVALAIGAAAAVLVVGSALALPRAWPTWLEIVPHERSGEPNLATLAVLLRPVPFGTAIAAAICVLAVLTALRADPRRPASAALWMAGALVAAPYARSYDHLLLLVPLLIVCAGASPRASNVLAAAIGLVLLILPWAIFIAISPALGSESATAIVPVVAFGLVALRARVR